MGLTFNMPESAQCSTTFRCVSIPMRLLDNTCSRTSLFCLLSSLRRHKYSHNSLSDRGHSDTTNRTFLSKSSSCNGTFLPVRLDRLGLNVTLVGDVKSGLSHWKSRRISLKAFWTQLDGLGFSLSLFCAFSRHLGDFSSKLNLRSSSSKSPNAFS